MGNLSMAASPTKNAIPAEANRKGERRFPIALQRAWERRCTATATSLLGDGDRGRAAVGVGVDLVVAVAAKNSAARSRPAGRIADDHRLADPQGRGRAARCQEAVHVVGGDG